MASITLQGVGKSYRGGIRAVRDVDLHVEDGEFLVLVGPTACGKSTLLRLVAGLEKVTEGRVLIGDRDVTDLEPKDRDVAMVFQGSALYPHLNAFDNAAFGLEVRKTPRERIVERVRRVAARLDIGELMDKSPGTMSGGERQSVAMSRALVRDPTVFLMDEPLANLDAGRRATLRSEIVRMHAARGTTTLYVTHDQVEAMSMGDRVAVLRAVDGDRGSTVQQVAEPRTLYDQPATLFVAGFIGSPGMNFAHGRVVGNESLLYVEFAGHRLFLSPEALGRHRALADRVGDEVIVGVRPESFEVAAAVPGGVDQHDRTIEVQIDAMEHLGSEAYVHFSLHTRPVASPQLGDPEQAESPGRVAGFTARVHPDHAPRPLTRTTLFVDTDRMHFFDATTGRTLR